MSLTIPNREALIANIDPADLEDLKTEAMKELEAEVSDDWNYRLPEQYQF